MASELYVETLKGLTSGANANKVIVPAGQTLDIAGSWSPPAGTVLQVVSVFPTTANQTTTANSFIDTDVSVSITPTSASSKFYVSASVNVYGYLAGQDTQFLTRLYRNSSIVISPITEDYLYVASQTVERVSQVTLFSVDSPNTSEELTYMLQVSSAGDTDVQFRNNRSSMVVMEIAG